MNFEKIFLTLLNPMFYRLRNRIKFQRGRVAFPHESKENLYPQHEIVEREKFFRETYHLDTWYERLSRCDYQLNLYHLDLLRWIQKRVFLPAVEHIQAVDIGSKNFYYAIAMAQFYQSIGTLENLDGIELDGYRVYADWHSRFDYAKTYIHHLPHVNYKVMNFLEYTKPANLITMFLPFVFERPLLLWGLPSKEYRPQALMKHAYGILQDNGVWLITNQGAEEYEAQHQLLYNLRIPYTALGEFSSPFYQYPISHFVTVVQKNEF